MLTLDDLEPDFLTAARERCAPGETCDECDAPAEYDTCEYLHCEACLLENLSHDNGFRENDRATRRAESGHAQ